MDADLLLQSNKRSLMTVQEDFDELKESRQCKAILPAFQGTAVLAESWYQARFFVFFTFNYPMLFLGILIRQTPRECSTWSFKYIHIWSEVKLLSCVRLFATPWTVACQTPPFMEFSRQGYWSGLPFPSPGDLPHPEIEPRPPALQADSLRCEPLGKPYINIFTHVCKTHN